MIRNVLLLVSVTALFSPHASPLVAEEIQDNIPQALFKYVQREEKAFDWKLNGKKELDQGTIYDLSLTSQKWHGVVWKHVLEVYEPKQVRYPNHMLLFVTGGRVGGRPDQEDIERGLALANLCGARTATIHQVPNQPLFGGRTEDDLITDTWLNYLKSGDETWPLLFPMVKSAVAAMDALEELSTKEWNTEIEGFVITGASKRGWTSWLTAVADERIIATAPIVIDVLNFRPQMKHQIEAWGKYSEQIFDYTSKGLIVEGEESSREKHLRRMMDPYTYRKQLELPKLLVNGANDRYWVCDAMKLYWPDLVGPKYVLQVPNGGHGLGDGKMHALSTIAAFFRHNASSTPMPKLTWHRTAKSDEIALHITSDKKPSAARMWVAHSNTKDFRESKWESKSLDARSKAFAGKVTKPAKGHVAHYGELQFQINGVDYSLCTLIQVD
jgi:PhoPQ-activated pathogenicity-related protein